MYSFCRHGPREVTKREEFSLKGQLQCEFKYAPFSREIRQPHIPSNEEKEIGRILEMALEPAVMLVRRYVILHFKVG